MDKIADPRPRLRAVRTPALIMRGQCDFIKWPVTREYATTLPDSTLVYVKGAGHGIVGDQPKVYLGLVRAFLEGKPLPLPAYTSAAKPT
jgi:pimeloyl-ACP methyl ester carboxylesterase